MSSHFDIPLDESVNVLKQVLPLMSARRVPTIPQNYAVWFDYVAERNDQLTAELKRRIDAGVEFDPVSCRTIYEQFYIDEMYAEVDGLQGAVREAVESALNELGGLGEDISHFAAVLDDCGESLKQDPTKEDLNRLVVDLVRETAKTKSRSDEVEGSLMAMADELNELRSQVDRLSKDSRTDALTGVANRRAFDDALKKLTRESCDSGKPLCLALADIDHFKKFNDTHGHLVGDNVLHFVAQEMAQCVKGRDVMARYGGEEFAIILPDTPLEGATMLAESIRTIVEAQMPTDENGEPIERVTVSMGVASFRNDEDVSTFIERADACLYQSKAEGRNRVTNEMAVTC